MTRDEVKNAVFEAIHNKVQISFCEIDDLSDIGLDSLDKLEIVMALEKKFGCPIRYKALSMGGLKRYTVRDFISDIYTEMKGNGDAQAVAATGKGRTKEDISREIASAKAELSIATAKKDFANVQVITARIARLQREWEALDASLHQNK